jgi:hypothetical protein
MQWIEMNECERFVQQSAFCGNGEAGLLMLSFDEALRAGPELRKNRSSPRACGFDAMGQQRL